ncbi:hypothetical protein L596_000371 [Steinernema carpocapsae]|uniref:Uncharacterized protein n=1 Tax=Steinernema carpocapsae TaxID=34508 RepID=A0A4U8UIK6_STECR|nr:hypothetical protein L596_000371 [Steinernema carpocapsae]
MSDLVVVFMVTGLLASINVFICCLYNLNYHEVMLFLRSTARAADQSMPYRPCQSSKEGLRLDSRKTLFFLNVSVLKCLCIAKAFKDVTSSKTSYCFDSDNMLIIGLDATTLHNHGRLP